MKLIKNWIEKVRWRAADNWFKLANLYITKGDCHKGIKFMCYGLLCVPDTSVQHDMVDQLRNKAYELSKEIESQ